MRVLNIIAQKPDSTGSGVYLAEMVRCRISLGHTLDSLGWGSATLRFVEVVMPYVLEGSR